MVDLIVIFKDASDETFYKVLAAVTSMKRKGVGKMKFGERYDTGWSGEVHFLSKESMGIFGNKIRNRRK